MKVNEVYHLINNEHAVIIYCFNFIRRDRNATSNPGLRSIYSQVTHNEVLLWYLAPGLNCPSCPPPWAILPPWARVTFQDQSENKGPESKSRFKYDAVTLSFGRSVFEFVDRYGMLQYGQRRSYRSCLSCPARRTKNFPKIWKLFFKTNSQISIFESFKNSLLCFGIYYCIFSNFQLSVSA